MVESLGLFGLFIGCLLSATIIPFSSEALLAGALALGFPPIWCLVVASCGNTLGGMTSYMLGWLCKWEWLEKYFHVKKEKAARFKDKVQKYGSLMGFLCFLPFVGDFIAIAMGFMRVNPWLSCLFMFIGKCLRYCAIVGVFDLIF